MTAKIAAILIVAICFNSMSAIVSDNDGSAFVTKAEFEAMKDNFADQVENYENSIDGKIDGAIAAYLAGIKTTRKTVITNMFRNAKINDKNNLVFALWATPAQAINVEDVVAGYFVGRADGGGDGANQTSGGKYGYCQVSNVDSGSGNYKECEYLGTKKKDSSKFYNDDKKNWTSAYYFVNFPFKGENEKKDLDNWTLQEIKRKRLHMHLKANYLAFMSASYTGNIGSRFSGTVTTDYTTTLTQPGSFKHSSQGNHCHITMQPICTQVHEWSDFDKDPNFSSTNDDEKKNLFLKYNFAGEVKDSTDCYAVEYEYRDYYNSNDEERFGSKESKNIQIQDRENDGATVTSYKGAGSRNGYMQWGSNLVNPVAKHDCTFMFKYYFQKIFNLKWTKLTNSYYDSLFNEPIYKYNGIPITNMNQTGKITFALTLNNSTEDAFKYCIMDKRHENGKVPEEKKETYSGRSIDRVLAYGELSGKKNHVVNIEFDKEVIWDKDKGDYIYLKVEPSKNGQTVTADIPGNVNAEFKLY